MRSGDDAGERHEVTEKTARARRLDNASRRKQLLATARQFVSAQGLTSFTMEALALAAGVNKAIPYRHFDNADAVLHELYREVNVEIGARVLEAANRADDVEDRIRAVVAAYFDGVADNADILKVLAGPISARSAFDDPRAPIDFAARLLMRRFDFTEERAWAAASILQGALWGGVGALMSGEATRPLVAEVLETMIRALVRDNAGVAH